MDLIADLSSWYDHPPLVQHWLAYYRRHGVLRFHLFVQEDPETAARWQAVLAARDVVRAWTYDKPASVGERADRFSDYCENELRDRPCVLVADLDEFIHEPARAARLLVEQGYDLIEGMLVDRFEIAGRSPGIDATTDLPAAFPLCTHFSFHALGATISKVPVMRPGLRLRPGHHGVHGREELRAPGWWIPVDHFKWHGNVVERMRARLARGNVGEKLRQECNTLLERFVVDVDRIDLSRIPTWLRATW